MIVSDANVVYKSQSAIYTDINWFQLLASSYPRPPAIPAKSRSVLCFEMPLCRYEPANKFFTLLFGNSTFSILYRTIVIYISHILQFINYIFAIYISHLRFINRSFVSYNYISHLRYTNRTFVSYKSHFCEFAISISHIWILERESRFINFSEGGMQFVNCTKLLLRFTNSLVILKVDLELIATESPFAPNNYLSDPNQQIKSQPKSTRRKIVNLPEHFQLICIISKGHWKTWTIYRLQESLLNLCKMSTFPL